MFHGFMFYPDIFKPINLLLDILDSKRHPIQADEKMTKISEEAHQEKSLLGRISCAKALED